MTPSEWARIDELFHHALTLPPEQRAAFLDTACETAEIRSNVELMLEHDGPIDVRFQEAVGAAAAAMVTEKRDWVIGRRIGPYRVTGVIGEGGMGTVYSAVRDDDAYQKEVAIKLVRHGLESGRVLVRFRAERQILARLEHSYIARMLDGGATEDGMPYLVMERINGEPVTAYADQRQLDLEARLRLFLKVCEAVQYAHSCLVIHRDIKPANILITNDGTPRLLDFGLARVLADDESEPQTTGAFLMTPAYASPEQISGRAVTTTTDVYSLAAVLYELLTGRQPHRLAGLSPLEGAELICKGEVEAASKVAGNALVPARRLSGDLDNILAMALRKEPGRRYRSVEQFAADLQRHLDGLPVVARADTLAYRATKFGQRNRWSLVAGTAVFLALAAGIYTSHEAAKRERRRFDQVRQLVNRVLFRVHDSIRPLAGSLEARELILHNALEYLNSLSAEAAGDAALQIEIAEAYRKLALIQGSSTSSSRGDSRAGLESLRKAVALGREAVAKEPRNAVYVGRLGESLLDLMRIEAQISEFEEARKSGEEAITHLERSLALNGGDGGVRANLGQAYSFLGLDVLVHLNDIPAAVNLVKKGIATSEQLAQSQSSPDVRNNVASAYSSLGRLLGTMRDTAGSREAYQRAVDIREQLVSEHPENAEFLRGLMIAYSGLADRIAESCTEMQLAGAGAARPIYEKMLAVARKLDVDRKDRTSQVDLGQALLRMGCLEENEGNYKEATALLNEGLERTQRFVEAESASTGLLLLRANLHVRYGRALLGSGRAQEAMAQYQRALEAIRIVDRRAPGVADIQARKVSIYGRMALALGKLGNRAGLESAAVEIRRLLRTADAGGSGTKPTPPSLLAANAIAPQWLGNAYHQLRNETAACLWWQESAVAWQRMETVAKFVPAGFQELRHQAEHHATVCRRGK